MGTRLESDTSFKGKREMDWKIGWEISVKAASINIDLELSPDKLREIADNMEKDYKADPDDHAKAGSFYGITLAQEAETQSPINVRILWNPLGKVKDPVQEDEDEDC